MGGDSRERNHGDGPRGVEGAVGAPTLSARSWSTVAGLRARFYDGSPSPFEAVLADAAAGARDILLFGAGRGASERDLREPGRRVVGLDVDPVVKENPLVDEAIVYGGDAIPLADATVDLVCARWVVEHLRDPASTFREVARVLRPGGRFVFQTPNAWFYSSLLARAIPNALHPWIVRRSTGRAERDTFDTYYRANTRRSLRRLLAAAGMQERVLKVELGDPMYLQFSAPTYALGVAFERVVNSTSRLEDLGHAIFGCFERVPGALISRRYKGL